MPQVEVTIGGRGFEVACQDGEEPFLVAAAKMLDSEAREIALPVPNAHVGVGPGEWAFARVGGDRDRQVGVCDIKV